MSFACHKNFLRTALIIFTSALILSIAAPRVFSAAAKKPAAAKPAPVKPDVKPVEFLFMPPDGTTFIESYKETSVTSVNGIKYIPEVIEWKSKVAIKREADGYRVTRTPVSYTETDIDQQTFNTIYSKCLKSIPLEYELELNGECIKVHGIDKAVEAIIEEVNKLDSTIEKPDEETRAELAEMLTLIEKSVWNSRYTQLLGLTIKPGECMKNGNEMHVFYGISVSGTTEFQALNTQMFNGRECAKVKTNAYTNSTRPEKDVMEYLKLRFSYMKDVREGGFSITNFSASSKSESMIEPATMLIHSETSKRSSKLEMITGIGIKTTLSSDDYAQYTYEYEKLSEGRQGE